MPKGRPSRPLPGMAALAPPRKARPRPSSGGGGSELEALLAMQIRALKLPRPEREWRFHPTRKWRFDLAWPDRLVAVEVEGGGWVQGRHGRGVGMAGDCEKYSHAAILGWRIVRCTGEQIKSGIALRWVFEALGGGAAYRPTDPAKAR